MVNATLNFQNNLPVSSDQLLEILNDLNIKYDLYNHKPLFTVEDTKKFEKINFLEDQKSVQVKNLYLRDKKKIIIYLFVNIIRLLIYKFSKISWIHQDYLLVQMKDYLNF